jgi:hypothetical protein
MKFTKDHEWVEVAGDVATVGITGYAAEQLGDVVFVEVPDVGKTVKQGEALAVVESPARRQSRDRQRRAGSRRLVREGQALEPW